MTFKLPEPVAWRYGAILYSSKVDAVDFMRYDNTGYPLEALFAADQMLAAYEQGKAENAKDAARLDFLQRTFSSLYTCTHIERRPSTAGIGLYEERAVCDGWAVGMHGQEKLTVREAIDDALKESAALALRTAKP